MNTFRVNNKRTSKSEKRTAVQSYQDSVDQLREIFNKLSLIMEGEAAIRFADPEVLRVLNETMCFINNVADTFEYPQPDSDGMMTFQRAASLKGLSDRRDLSYSIFKGNTVIETFNEFQYFTGMTSIPHGIFENCSNLREVTIPICSASEIGDYPITGTKITRWIVPEGYTTFNTITGYYGTTLELVDYPSTTEKMNNFMWNNDCKVFVCRALNPPVLTSWGRGIVSAIYVPDESVNAYKTASGWSSKASVIYPLSTYKKDY